MDTKSLDVIVTDLLEVKALFKCKFLSNHHIVPNAEIICIEFHQLKRKWLLLECYKPPSQSDY